MQKLLVLNSFPLLNHFLVQLVATPEQVIISPLKVKHFTLKKVNFFPPRTLLFTIQYFFLNISFNLTIQDLVQTHIYFIVLTSECFVIKTKKKFYFANSPIKFMLVLTLAGSVPSPTNLISHEVFRKSNRNFDLPLCRPYRQPSEMISFSVQTLTWPPSYQFIIYITHWGKRCQKTLCCPLKAFCCSVIINYLFCRLLVGDCLLLKHLSEDSVLKKFEICIMWPIPMKTEQASVVISAWGSCFSIHKLCVQIAFNNFLLFTCLNDKKTEKKTKR